MFKYSTNKQKRGTDETLLSEAFQSSADQYVIVPLYNQRVVNLQITKHAF